MHEALADKILILGIDGMDPRLTKRYISEGKMPNTKKFLERGSAHADLKMIGGHPTVTPPMWTTMGTGASPYIHGVLDFFKKGDRIGEAIYNFDSRNCKAEPLWNVFAEAGIKTLVWHWPGSSWPPTSDNPNLFVVDGTQPEGVNCGIAAIDPERLLIASEQTPEVMFRTKAASDSDVPCFISGMEVENNTADTMVDLVNSDVVMGVATIDNATPGLSETPLDLILSPIKPATGWVSAPADAKECTLLHSAGLIHRPCLLLKNAQGIYDQLAIYKNKKEATPLVTLTNNVFAKDIVDEALKGDEKVLTNRNMRILEMAPDGSSLRMWISTAMDFHNDSLWYPKSMLSEIVENVGYPQPICLSGGHDKRLISDCMRANWDVAGQWTADSLKYMARNKDFKMIFSHFHNVDMQGHMLVAYLKNGSKLPPETCQKLFEDVYVQTDEYIGQVMPLLDEGWTIIILSDHGQTCPEHDAYHLAITPFMNGIEMVDLGYTTLKKDDNGKDLAEIDWSKTTAVSWRMGEIWINLKGRDAEGIVDPADKYELEEKIITDLYGLKDAKTGHRTILLAMHNKDAVLLGMGGADAGDIIFFTAEGYTADHADSLSTVDGACGTSVSSTFMAAGKGIKVNHLITDRIIHHVDVAATVSALGGVRMTAQCEGAPVYQILDAGK